MSAISHSAFSSPIFILVFGFSLLSCSHEGGDTIQVLLVTGGGWHDYETQEELLIQAMDERIGDRIEWTVVHEGDGEPNHHVSIMREENWAADYDLVVHNTGFGRVNDPEYVSHVVQHHLGTPAVLIHAAVLSYRYAEPADPWFEFMGLQSMWHEDQREFEVENIAPDHPIMRDFPETWTTPADEVYVIEKVWGDITPLARTFGAETKEYQTVTWTHEFEGNRIFATTLGHNNEMFKQKEFLNKVANGILWAVNEL